MNIKTLSISLLIAISASAGAVSVVDMEDVSRKASELTAGWFADTTTSTTRPIIPTVESPKPVVHDELRPRAQAAVAPQTQQVFGSFPAPNIFPDAHPTLYASVFAWNDLRQERQPPRKLPVSIPYWVPHKRQIVMPTARIEGVLHEGVNLEMQPDGTFKQLYTSTVSSRADISAANYRAGNLVLTSLMVGDVRFSNIKLALRPDGSFEIVEAYVPIAVKDTSTENYKELPFGTQTLPSIRGIFFINAQQNSARSFADFTQTGEYTYFADVIEWFASTNPRELSSIHFFRNIRGSWVSQTSAILAPNARLRGCEQSRKSIVSDFNGDEIPDVFVACHGSEHATVLAANGNVPRERPYFIISRLDGMYDVRTADMPEGMYHAAVAIDTKGDGFADIYVGNQLNPVASLQRLKNNRDGSFQLEAISGRQGTRANIWAMEIFERNNKRYIGIAGSDTVLDSSAGLNPTVYELTSNGDLALTPEFTIPSLHANQAGSCGDTCFSVNLDMVIEGDTMYVLKVNSNYSNYAIIAHSLTSNSTRQIHTHDGFRYQQYAPGVPMPMCLGFHGQTWIDFIRVHNNKLITDAACVSPNVKLN